MATSSTDPNTVSIRPHRNASDGASDDDDAECGLLDAPALPLSRGLSALALASDRRRAGCVHASSPLESLSRNGHEVAAAGTQPWI